MSKSEITETSLVKLIRQNAACILFALSLSACTTTPSQVTEIKTLEINVIEYVLPDQELLKQHEYPKVYEGMTYEQLEDVALECAATIKQCNADKAAILSIETEKVEDDES